VVVVVATDDREDLLPEPQPAVAPLKTSATAVNRTAPRSFIALCLPAMRPRRGLRRVT